VQRPAEPAHPPAAAAARNQYRTAIWLLAVNVVFLVGLALLRADPHWERLLTLYQGFEALVLTAAGAIFGTVVQRGTVNDARAETASARAQAQAAQERAEKAREQATAASGAAARGEALAGSVDAVLGAAVGAASRRVAAGTEPLRGPTRGTARQPAPEELAALAALARTLFPHATGAGAEPHRS
jgi:hypothetical protein